MLRTIEQHMDRRARASYQTAHDDLRGRGCAGGGYRLGAADGDDYPLCGRHLVYDWRLFTAYLDDGRIVEVAIDRHTHATAVGQSCFRDHVRLCPSV